VWAVFAGSLFFTLLIFFTGNWQFSIFTGTVAAASFVYLMARMIVGSTSGQHVTPDKRFGKGPYTRYGCASSAQFAKQLADMLRKLQEGALRENWTVDWVQLKALTSHAESATKNRDHSTAIRSYGRAVSFLMDQLRNQTDASSSSVEL
jgi:protein phosphatase